MEEKPQGILSNKTNMYFNEGAICDFPLKISS